MIASFKFPCVNKRLPPHVIDNVVDKWCTRKGAIRYIHRDERTWTVYVDVNEWLPAGFEMRDKLAALKEKGTFDKADIPVHPLKFGRYLLVCPSFTLEEHDAYVADVGLVEQPIPLDAGWDAPVAGWDAPVVWDGSLSWEVNVE